MVSFESPAQHEIAATDLEEILFHPQEAQQLTEVPWHLPEPRNNSDHHQ